jgi:hypothetical protein
VEDILILVRGCSMACRQAFNSIFTSVALQLMCQILQ